MENPARAQRMADAIAAELAGSSLRYIVGVRDNQVIAIVSGPRRLSGWTAPHTLLADRVCPHLRRVGPAALIGLSSDAPSTSHIPRAVTEARIALDHADVANRVLPFTQIPFRRTVIAEARAGVQSALPAWLDDFVRADQRARGALSATLRAYADCNMNALRASRALSVHANTIYSRMQRIERITGRNPLEYHPLTEMLLALDCRRD